MSWTNQLPVQIQTPDNIPSMEAMVEYSNTFSGGQTSLFIFDASKHINEDSVNEQDMKIRSLEVLDAMDALERKIADVPYTNTTSLITFLESVPVVFQEPTTGVTLYDGTLGVYYTKNVGNQMVLSVRLGCFWTSLHLETKKEGNIYAKTW